MQKRVQTAMIIDIDAILGNELSVMLESRKIYSLAIPSLPEAEDCLTRLKPTVIFLENSFPDGLGVNFISHIKKTDKEIKIVMMTGDKDEWVEKKAKQEGVNYFLRKPFTSAAFNKAIDAVYKKRS